MAKFKVYDIRPKKKSYKPLPVQPTPSRKIEWNFQPILKILAGVLLVFLLIWYFMPAQSATIKLYPTIKEYTSEVAISVSKDKDTKIDYNAFVLPGHYLETTKEVVEEFESSLLDISTKAKGTVRVFNKFSRNITLVKNTRLISATEPARLFYLTRRITIPANGYVDVEVVASEPGEEYNIEPTTFSIPGLRNFSPPELYYDVFAKSFKKMEGGRKQTVKKITKEDLEKAKTEMKKILDQKIPKLLEETFGKDYFFVERTIKYEILEEGLKGANVGDEVDKFKYGVKVKISGWAIKKEDLQKFGEKYLESQIPPGFTLAPATLDIQSTLENVDLDGNISVNLEIKGKVYEKIDENFFQEISKGQTKKTIIKNIYQVYQEFSKRPQIQFSPFFARRAPTQAQKINIQIILD